MSLKEATTASGVVERSRKMGRLLMDIHTSSPVGLISPMITSLSSWPERIDTIAGTPLPEIPIRLSGGHSRLHYSLYDPEMFG